MSDAVSGFSALPLMPQTAVSDKAVLFDPPDSLAALPFATEIPAKILPAGEAGRQPVLQIVTEAGETVSIPVRPPFQITRPLQLKVRVLPNDIRDSVTFKMLFPTKTAVKPETPKAAGTTESVRDIPSGSAAEPPVAAAKATAAQTLSFPAEGYLLRSVPDKLAELFPDLVPPENTPLAAPKTSQIFMDIIPDDNAVTVFAERPAAPTGTETVTPASVLPAPEEDIVPNIIIKMPEENEPAAVPVRTEKAPDTVLQNSGETPVPSVSVPSSPAPDTVSYSEKTADTEKPPLVRETALPSESAPEQPAPAVPKETGKTQPPPQPAPTVEKNPPSATMPATENKEPVRFETGSVLKGVVYKPDSSLPTLIATKSGVFAVTEDVPLPHAAPVTVKITALSRPAELLPDIPEQDAPLPFKNPWAVLSHALESVQTTDTDAYAEMLAVLPKAGDKLPALMMNFMTAATKGVPFTAWLGEDVIAALRKTEKGDRLLRRLEKEFSAEPKKATDRSGSAWKGWNIPVLSGSVVEPVSLYLQRPPQDDNNAAQSAKSKIARSDSVRFVLDLRLSRLGKLQLEGLANRKNKTFNLTIRHSDSLPPTFETDVRKIFTATLDALSYAGTVSIMQTNDFIDFSPADNLQQGVWA